MNRFYRFRSIFDHHSRIFVHIFVSGFKSFIINHFKLNFFFYFVDVFVSEESELCAKSFCTGTELNKKKTHSRSK